MGATAAIRRNWRETVVEEDNQDLVALRLDLMTSAYLAIALVPALGRVPDESVVSLLRVDESVRRATAQGSPFYDME